MKHSFYKLFLVFLLLAVLVVRFSQVPQLGYFMLDEERDAFLVRRLLVDHRPLLIGGAVPGGLYLGPLFFYLSAIPYSIAELNPLGPAYAAGLIGVISVVATYIVGRKLLDSRVALIASVFSTFSLLNIIYHRPWWPLTLSQLVTLGVYFSLIQLTSQRKIFNVLKHYSLKKWFLMLIGLLVVGAQTDPSTLSLIPLSVIWLWRRRKQIKLSRKMAASMIGLFLLSHATWFIFELRHDFLNTRAAVGLFSKVIKGPALALAKAGPFQTFKMTAGVLYRLFIPTGALDVTKQINPAEEFLRLRLNEIWWPGAWGILIVLSVYTLLNLKGYTLKGVTFLDKQVARQLLSLHFLISISGILIYTSAFPGYIHEWMWAFMFPTFFLIFADLSTQLMKKVHPFKDGPFMASIMLVGLMAWSVWQATLFWRLQNVAGLGVKLHLVKEVQAKIAGRLYELQSIGEFRYGGWRYLFTLYGQPPVKSYMDYVYQDWLYPVNDANPEIIVVINNLHDKPATFTISENSELSDSLMIR